MSLYEKKPVYKVYNGSTLIGKTYKNGGSVGVSASVEIPGGITGLEAWYDAADAATITLDSGRVATWGDKSPKNRDVSNITSGTTQPSYEANAQNGLPVVRFAAASSQFLAATTASDWNWFHQGDSTVFIAGDFVAVFTALLATLTGNEIGNGAALYLNSGGRLGVVNRIQSVGSAISINSLTGLYSNNVASILEFIMRPANATAANRAAVGVNRAATNLTNTESAAPSANDAAQPLQMARVQNGTLHASFDAYEILMYSRELNASEALAVRQYLYSKWGVTGT